MSRSKIGQNLINANGMILFLPSDPENDYMDLTRPDPFTETSDQRYPLGTKLVWGDQEFRYAKMGGSAVTKGKLLQTAVAAADHVKDLAIAAAAAASDLSITITNGSTTAITADLYKEGYIFINDVDGEGQCLKIKSNAAASTGASCVITLHDDYPLTTALTTNSQAGLRKNKFDSLVVSPTTRTGKVVGVTPRNVTASYYFWAQTKGPAAVLTNGTVIVGLHAVPGATTAGSVDVRPLNSVDAGGQEQVVGEVLQVAASTEYSLIDLALE